MVIYFIIIGDILCSYASKITNVPEWEVYYTHRGFYAFLMSLPLSIFIFKKEIHELKLASFFLLFAVVLFILIMSMDIGLSGLPFNPDKDKNHYFDFVLDRELFTSVSVFITAYGF
jgi:amino acid permease